MKMKKPTTTNLLRAYQSLASAIDDYFCTETEDIDEAEWNKMYDKAFAHILFMGRPE